MARLDDIQAENDLYPPNSIGRRDDVAASGDTGTYSVIALLKRMAAFFSGGSTAALSVNLNKDSAGNAIIVSPVTKVDSESADPTYAVAGSVTVATSATDVVVIPGSATKTVKILRVGISLRATAAGNQDVALIKHSTANSGGTSTGSPVPKPLDSLDAASTVTPLQYTANPTPGTVVGTLRQTNLSAGASAAAGAVERVWTFGAENGKALTLRGVAESVAINFGAATIAGAQLDWWAEFKEI
jgi:hypothetical protein